MEPRTSEAVVAHLEGVAQRFSRGEVVGTQLESASEFPGSVAVACHFLRCLMVAGGKLDSDEFWHCFTGALVDHVQAGDAHGGERSPLQTFCVGVARGDMSVFEDIDASLWPHALILAQLVSSATYERLLVQISGVLRQGLASQSTAGLAGCHEAADPMVQALLFLYDALGRPNFPECTESMLVHWPAYLAVCSVVLRPHSQHHALGRRLLEKLGAGLADRGDAFGAHICYLLTGERKLDAVDAPASLVCLIGVDHRTPKNFTSLLDPLALQLSEVFEYAIRCGDPEALYPSIQPFKLAHALLLSEVGLVDKARKYMTLLHAFVKAVPHNRLSDAFRSSMRELNELLNPSGTAAPKAGPPADSPEAPRVGRMVKDLFRGLAETTGLAVKATPPPALLGDDDEGPSGFAASMTGMAAPAPAPFAAAPPMAVSAPMAPRPQAFAAPQQHQQQPPPQFSQPLACGYPPTPGLGYPQALGGCGGCYGGAAAAPLLGGGGGEFGGEAGEGGPPRPREPQVEPIQDALNNDPLLNAGKAVWSGMKGLLSAVTGDAQKQGGQGGPQGDGSKDSKPNQFYYDEVAKRWRERGKEDAEPDASEYDPMTGKKINSWEAIPPPPSAGGQAGDFGAPPPMGGPPMGGPPMGGPPMGGPPPMGACMGARAGAVGRGSLYVDPLSGNPHLAPPVAAPMQRPPHGAASGGPLASPFGGGGGGPLASPFGAGPRA